MKAEALLLAVDSDETVGGASGSGSTGFAQLAEALSSLLITPGETANDPEG